MEADFIKLKNRKNSNSSSSSDEEQQNEEEKYIKSKSEKEKTNVNITYFEKTKTEIEEAEKLQKTFSQRIKDLFKTKAKDTEEESPLIKDVKRTIEEIVISKGFKFESHYVKTEDGYTLALFRIPGGKKCENGSLLPPVLLQHGVFDSSDGWICNGEDHSIAFVLANKNFDVWLSNSRGNKYCKKHEKYDEKSYEFWQFSFNELGIYDVPAVIKYIREVNKSGEKIIYFGHSQGTSLMFSGLAQKFDFYKES